MKLKFRENSQKDRRAYPYIGTSKHWDRIIYFISPNTGVCLSSKGYDVGSYSDNWDEESYKPWYGTIKVTP